MCFKKRFEKGYQVRLPRPSPIGPSQPHINKLSFKMLGNRNETGFSVAFWRHVIFASSQNVWAFAFKFELVLLNLTRKHFYGSIILKNLLYPDLMNCYESSGTLTKHWASPMSSVTLNSHKLPSTHPVGNYFTISIWIWIYTFLSNWGPPILCRYALNS